MARPTLITVHGTYLKPDGTPETGTVTFRSEIFSLSSGDDTVMAPGPVRVSLDNTGSFSVQIPSTTDPAWSPVGWTYAVHVRLSDGAAQFHVMIPHDLPGAELSLSEMLPTVETDGNLYAAYSHTHEGMGGGGGAVDSVNGRTGTVVLTKTDVGLANVDNTADASKPVSSAVQTALNAKAPTASPTFTGTVSGISKAMVGLGNVDNTADSAKPISTATQTALNGKAATSHTHAISDVTNLQSSLDAKASTASVTSVSDRVTAVEDMTPSILVWSGSAYVESTTARIYVGPTDPGAVPNGSVWIEV